MRKSGLCCRLVSVCSSITLVYCNQMAEDIVKLFVRSGSPIILVLDPQCQYPIPRGTPSAEVQNTKGGKIKSPFILVMVQDRLMVAMER